VGAVALLPAATARAADVEQAAQVLRLNREAMELYESLEFELARKSLDEALALGSKAGLEQHVVMARTHVNLGLVHGVGLKDGATSIVHFKRALEIKPDTKLPKEAASPQATALFSQAARELKAGKGSGVGGAKEETVAKAAPAAASKPAGKDAELDELLAGASKGTQLAKPDPAPAPAAAPALPAVPEAVEPSGEIRSKGSAAGALKCPSGGEVDAGDDITLRCVTSGGLTPASVILFYKRSGREDFTALPMRTAEGRMGSWTARIPGTQVTGGWMPYYFEARDGRGTALALAGRDDSPNIITIKGGRDDDDEPKVEKARRSRRTAEEASDDEENPLARLEDEKRREAAMESRIFIGLGIGAGGGYAGGAGVEAYRSYVRGFSPGLAPQGLGHAVPEVGFFVTPDFALSLQARAQYIPRQSRYTAAGAMSVLARALFFFGEGDARFYGALAAGGGEGVRMVVTADTTTGGQVKDTVRGGPVLAGGSLGFSYALGSVASWMIEVGTLAGFPTFSVAFDANTGLRLRF
jgi:hypothetical protein